MASSVRVELKVTANIPFGNSGSGLGGAFPFHALTLENPPWKDWRPGQFVMMRAQWGSDGAECARALPICRVTPQGLVLFFRNDEKTSRFIRLRQGDKVLLWGPLGNGFTLPPGKKILLLASEEGIAPFAGLADRHPDVSRLFMLFGHGMPTACYPFDAMASRINMEEMLTDGDGALDAFYASMFEKMEKFRRNNGICLACGPMKFLRDVWKKSVQINIPTQLFLSKKMICGVGACYGCAVQQRRKTHDEAALPLRACVNGPVFRADDIDLEPYQPGRDE